MGIKSVFLGLGKVNQAIAKRMLGPQWAYVEDGEELVVLEALDGLKFKEVTCQSGNFDSFNWAKEMPARVFVSPGVDPRRSFFAQIEKYEVRELDLFAEKFQKPIICITGTDGKSTFTLQLGEILKRALHNHKIFVGGNLGTAMFEALGEDYDLAVLEVSSFQCERLRSISPDFGILLNLATDHLDRYDRLEDYFEAKWGMLKRSKVCFYPQGVAAPKTIGSSAAGYGNDASISEILKSVTAVLGKKLNFEISPQLFENLPTLAHRLELYQAIDHEFYFVNDSKATTVHAALYGYQRMREKFKTVKLILGGKYKGDEFRPLALAMRSQDQILLCGQARTEISKQLVGVSVPVINYDTLKIAVESVLSQLKAGDCLMLSPGCSSYDEFENFEERGKMFVDAIERCWKLKRLA